MAGYYQWQEQDLVLHLKVIPRSSMDSLEPFGDRLKAKITAPPVDGKANKHLTKFLAKQFKVPASKVELIRGETQSLKSFIISSPKVIPDFIQHG